MVFNFAVDLSKPRKAVQQSGFGDFRAGGSVAGGSGRQQKPQPDTRDEKQKEAPSKAAQAAAQKAAQAAVVEKESDEEEEEEAPAAPADKDVAVNPEASAQGSEVVAEKGTTKEKTDADENQRFVWDAAKGMLVPEKDLQQEDEDGSEDGSEDEDRSARPNDKSSLQVRLCFTEDLLLEWKPVT
ncbi:unnamed protein product [Polarella glacialis]|uniref:Uncharacterized protein n=1 Tax=Polarella glacialis TaxID=89957 RepID=A0A813K518_POLGL|nr:unnamed protein product [Polarella glacialis]